MTLTLTPDERDYLIRLLGGPSQQGTRTLGVGLTAVGVLAFRDKVFKAAEEPVDWVAHDIAQAAL